MGTCLNIADICFIQIYLNWKVSEEYNKPIHMTIQLGRQLLRPLEAANGKMFIVHV